MEVLCQLGFSEKSRVLIFNCVSSPCFSVELNGSSKGFFKSSCGFQQGNPLSPYLYPEEVLSRMLRKEFLIGQIKPFNPCGGMVILHVLYADGLLLFLNGGKKYIRGMMRILHVFQRMFGHLVNLSKSFIYFSSNFPLARKEEVLGLTGFSKGAWPCIY